jgi:hypothetical protein
LPYRPAEEEEEGHVCAQVVYLPYRPPPPPADTSTVSHSPKATAKSIDGAEDRGEEVLEVVQEEEEEEGEEEAGWFVGVAGKLTDEDKAEWWAYE